MGLTRKKALERLESLAVRVEEHIAELNQSPTSTAADHWRAEIENWLGQTERLTSHVGKKTSAQWLDRIADWRQQSGVQ